MLSAFLLSACGGGTDRSIDSTSSSTIAGTGTLFGIAVASDTGLALANVQVTVSGKTFITANDGSFKQDGVTAAERSVVRFAKAGYADAFVTTSITNADTGTGNLVARLSPIAASTTFANSSGAILTDATSAAFVSFPAQSLIIDGTGAQPQGAVTASIAVIDPAGNPQNMPGDYRSSAGDTIESFGALSVTLRDASGNRLNLAPGQRSTIRIPLSTRSAAPPSSIPLYYFDEQSGLWVEEGTARLAGTAPDQYYEGTYKCRYSCRHYFGKWMPH